MLRGMLVGLAVLAAAGSASAEVKSSAPDGFTLSYEAVIPLAKEQAWARLVKVGSWWSAEHSYSGDAKYLTLDPRPGGCWCEIWPKGKIEHGRVVMVMPTDTLRVDADFGPLQAMGVTGALTFTLKPGDTPTSTKLSVTYVVNGGTQSKLDTLAPAVDQVMATQIRNLATPPK